MKRRFQFRLERVRRVRLLEERLLRAERAEAEGLARAAEASRDEARAVLEESRSHLRALLSGELPLGSVLAGQRLLDGELSRLRQRIESVRTLRAQAERITAVHREKKTAARALDELRERARVRHATELGKLENAELDEVAQRRLPERAENGKAEGPSRSSAGSTDPVRPSPPAP